jgi:hypothetical protein
MSRFGRAKLAGLLVGATVLVLGGALGEEPAAQKKKTIEGTVEVGETDGEGNVLSVSIWDADHGAVLITKSGKGGDLLRMIGARVQATGTLRPREDDAEYDAEMDVQSYKVLERAEPEPHNPE